jgi:hypothetical protein
MRSRELFVFLTPPCFLPYNKKRSSARVSFPEFDHDAHFDTQGPHCCFVGLR